VPSPNTRTGSGVTVAGRRPRKSAPRAAVASTIATCWKPRSHNTNVPGPTGRRLLRAVGPPLVDLAGPDPRVADGARAARDQQDQERLRPSAAAARRAATPEGAHVGRGIGPLDGGPVEGHEPPTEEECAGRRRRRQRAANRPEEGHDWPRAEAVARPAQCPGGRPFGPRRPRADAAPEDVRQLI